MLSFTDPFSLEEREAWKRLMLDVYRQFTTKAAEGRKMEISKLEGLAQGRVFSGRMAVANGLADQLGTLDDAVAEARTLAGVPAEEKTDLLILPGQGAFRDCSVALAGGLGEALRAHIEAGKPYLGICLGLQALFETSEEAPGARGLGLFAGGVVRLADGAVEPSSGEPVKVPHMGWNRVELVRAGAGPLRVFDADPPWLYFVHSYVCVPDDPSLVVATADHGGPFCAAIARGPLFACQFHPEKSGPVGRALVERFLAS